VAQCCPSLGGLRQLLPASISRRVAVIPRFTYLELCDGMDLPIIVPIQMELNEMFSVEGLVASNPHEQCLPWSLFNAPPEHRPFPTTVLGTLVWSHLCRLRQWLTLLQRRLSSHHILGDQN
jgi:hypothetical protein